MTKRSIGDPAAKVAGWAALACGFPAAARAASEAGMRVGVPVLPSLLRVSGAVVLVLAVLLGSAFLLRRFPLSRLGGRGAGRTIEVLERFYLNSKTGLYLVKVGRKKMLLGVGPAQVSLIAELKGEDVESGSSEEGAAFPAQLERFLSGILPRGRDKQGAECAGEPR